VGDTLKWGGILGGGHECYGDITSGPASIAACSILGTENSWRLDSLHGGGHRRDIPCLVDASDVGTVSALKNHPAWSTSAMASLRQLSGTPADLGSSDYFCFAKTSLAAI
jgi:hypothetical protein